MLDQSGQSQFALSTTGFYDVPKFVIEAILRDVWSCILLCWTKVANYNLPISGGFRNLGKGVQPLVCENFGLPRPLPVTRMHSRLELLRDIQFGLSLNWISRSNSKHLEISKELIRECVTVHGCCCCMPLLHNHLIDSCITSRQRGVHLHIRQILIGHFGPTLAKINLLLQEC